jgi:hypothetical protein
MSFEHQRNPNQDPAQGILEQIRSFSKADLQIAYGMILFGMGCLAAGVVATRAGVSNFNSASLPLLILGVCILAYGNLLRKRAALALSTVKAQSDLSLVPEYLTSLDEFSRKLRRTRDIGALVLAVSIAGLLLSCLVPALMFATGAWLAIVAVSGLLSLESYIHVFRMELHAHEVQRRL